MMLRVDNISKSFDGVCAINGCSLEVQEGTITGLIGPNGAGKTTLFNVITGFHKPDTGQIFFKDQRIDGLTPDKIFHKKIYRTFQITREFEQMTVLENLMLVPHSQIGESLIDTWFRTRDIREQEKDIKQSAFEVLDFLELTRLKDEYAGTLSGGQKKLLELGKTLMANPELVLLDEPGAGVNPKLMKKITDNIRFLNKEKKITFLLIEHDMDLVMNLCDPIIVLSQGTKIAEGSAEEIRTNEEVVEAYLGGQNR